MRIAFIGFGEAGAAIAESLGASAQFIAYDIALGGQRDDAIRKRAQSLGVAVAETSAAAIDGADWIVSAVTATSCVAAAQSAAAVIRPGQTYIDINSVSAGSKHRAAAAVEAAGGHYIDMAVMAPVHPRGHRTPTLVAGKTAQQFGPHLTALDFKFDVVSAQAGDATAIKMIRSLFVKGLEAITVQSMLAAREAGCFDAVYESLSSSFAVLGWPDHARYQLERVATHGVRRAAEMHESAVAMRDLGFERGGALADAIADLQEEIGALGIRLDPDAELLDAVDTILVGRKDAE